MTRFTPRLLSATLALAIAAAFDPVHAATAELTAEAVNDVAATTGAAATLRAQVLLDRAHFSPGEIDGGGGSNTVRAIAAFQRSRDLADDGKLGAATWKALNADTAEVLVRYTIAAADVGPFNALPDDMMEKSKLTALGYTSAAEALGEKFHASPKLLQRLNPGKDLDKAGTEILVPNIDGGAPLPQAAKVVVDKSDSSVALVDAADKTIARYPASTGSEHDPLPVGEWKIKGVARNPEFHYNPALFWDADPAHAKAKLAPGPNNPVGTVWVDLSKEHYGIHGTPEPSKVGKTESHGCIRLSNWTADALAAAVAPGTPAILQE